MEPLDQLYWKVCESDLDEKGIAQPHLLALRHDGKKDVAKMLHVEPEEIFDIAVAKFVGNVQYKEVIFGIDRFTQPGQGTKYDDVFTVYWWRGEQSERMGWTFGVINYRPPPNKVFEPIDWNNAFWNETMWQHVLTSFEEMRQRIRQFQQLGLSDQSITALRRVLDGERERIMREAAGKKPH